MGVSYNVGTAGHNRIWIFLFMLPALKLLAGPIRAMSCCSAVKTVIDVQDIFLIAICNNLLMHPN